MCSVKNKQFWRTSVFKTLIAPLVTDGAVFWTWNNDIAKRLAALERKVLRRMFGGIEVYENLRKRNVEELMQLFGDLDIFRLSG